MQESKVVKSKGPIVSAVVLDIEGTTTPISFVADTLFPYIRRELREYVESRWDEPLMQQDFLALRELSESREDLPNIPAEGSKEELQDALCQCVTTQMDSDMKTTALKALQGHMWKDGYANGELQGEVYDDVITALNKWRKIQLPVYIYSSGSVGAQKLLFGNSTHGNLLDFFSGHFDTNIGLKVEAESYGKIAEEIEIEGKHILFVTDNINEAYAAQQSSWNVVIADRPGNHPLPDDHPFPVANHFSLLWQFHEKYQIPKAIQRVPRVGIAICVVRNNKVLMGQRIGSHGKGEFAFPGGHLEFGEDPEECALRETLEETGLRLKNMSFATYVNDVAYGLHYITLIMQAELEDEKQEAKVMEPDKCAQWVWADWDSLPEPVFHGLQVLKRTSWRPY